MGVLEDAIREHLELKRQHGASEQELTDQEKEALGPARRNVSGEEAADEAVVVAEPSAEVAALPTATEQEVEPAPVAEEERMEAAPDPTSVLPSEPPPDAAGEGAAAVPSEAPPAVDPAEHAQQPPEPHEPAFAEPEEVRFDEEEPAVAPPMPAPQGDERLPGEEPEDEDVLEETPEFLQETPEHDRLWFEQKPPRDFDFE